jgi:hypothetical protein
VAVFPGQGGSGRYSTEQMVALAYRVGFRGSALVTAVSVAEAESGFDPLISGYNRTPGGRVTSIDRGLWQINNVYHSEVSDSCAYDALCNAIQAYRISAHGTYWHPWSTWLDGINRQYIPHVQSVFDGREWQAWVPLWGGQQPGRVSPSQTSTAQGSPTWSWADLTSHSGRVLSAAHPHTMRSLRALVALIHDKK